MNTHLIPDVLRSDDILYHYCKSKTAINYILKTRRIRLSPRRKSKDPTESTKPFISYSGVLASGSKEISDGTVEIRRRHLNLVSNTKQICFCRNKLKSDFPGVFQLPAEYFSFLKPRMWNQYGFDFMGVCLAFSRVALIEQASSFIHGPVDYRNYTNMASSQQSIDIAAIDQVGIEEYWKPYSKFIMEHCMFRKHEDYAGENEYRFMSFSENKYDYIDISNALRGIVVHPAYIPDDTMKALDAFAEEFNVELIRVTAENHGVYISTKKLLDTISRKIADISSVDMK